MAGTRPIDTKATATARKRHAAGVALLNEIFGWDPETAAEHKQDRRRTQGHGRALRRRKTKAQRIARRRNRR